MEHGTSKLFELSKVKTSKYRRSWQELDESFVNDATTHGQFQFLHLGDVVDEFADATVGDIKTLGEVEIVELPWGNSRPVTE
jgi:hypothetical protein